MENLMLGAWTCLAFRQLVVGLVSEERNQNRDGQPQQSLDEKENKSPEAKSL
jgi:hypothetical protein